jgi:hypothetical protein
MPRIFRTIQWLPIRLVLLYTAGTFSVFAFGPFDWPVDNWATLTAFLTVAMVSLWTGFHLAMSKVPKITIEIKPHNIILLGSIAAVSILFIAAPIYTGKTPWDVFDALRDQGAAYSGLQDQLELTSGSRGPIALARILTWPFVFAAIPLGILRWTQLRVGSRLLIAVIVLSIVISSVLRGTDREFADILIVTLSSVGILGARTIVSNRTSFGQLIRYAKYVIIVGVAVVIASGTLFIQRKEQRYVDARDLCIGQSEQTPTGICADFEYTPFVFLDMSERHRFAASMAVAYFSQGYYGLSLALDLGEFKSTWGIGHAPFVAALYKAITGDEELYARSYTYRLRDIGWSDEHQWSTMFPWLANDMSFFGVLILMLLLGIGFGASWRDAVFAGDDRAAVVFAVFSIMFGYLPANSQVTLVPDHYFALLVWLTLWMFARRQAKISNKSSVSIPSSSG